jgi:chromosome segregation protein
VEAIVTSKPKDRRMLIEEAAGLGKHRKRRRRAQLKLERTQDNLDRALDVEREARTRLRPLKRQAEAAELHERIERQSDEARWTLAREDVRAAGAALAEAVEAARAAQRGGADWLAVATAQEARELRAAGINTEVYLEQAKLGNQLTYADRKGFRLAIIAGENEFGRDVVQIKNLATKTPRDVPVGDIVSAVNQELR